MAQSPTKSQKQMLRQKRKKKQAFQSFLQKGQQTASIAEISNQSDHQQKLQVINQCTVCRVQLGDRRKFCGFCRDAACTQHLRKKRKNKGSNKFVRICDKCEDRYLFDKYMKLELKQQESISAHQGIVMTKKAELEQLVHGRKTKLQMMYNKQNQLLRQKKQNDIRYKNQINDLNSKLEKIQKKQNQLQQMQKQLKTMQQKLPASLQQDYNALQIQNDKIVKDLVKYQKLCNEAVKTKSKKQKQIYEEYSKWQSKQKKIREIKKDDDCSIF